MDPQLIERLDALERKIDAVGVSAEKARKYMLTMLIATAVTVILPLIGIMILAPMIFSTFNDAYGDLLQPYDSTLKL